jgi:hypothetical protein
MTYGIGNPDPGLMKAQNVAGLTRGFKVFYNRRYFLNFRRYLKN